VARKLFDLINDGEIYLEADSKIIKKESLAKALSGDEMLAKIKEDAEKYRADVIKEIEAEKTSAREEGYQEGFNNWLELIAKQEAEIKQVRKDYEKILVPVLIKAVKKIVGHELENRQDTIIDIIGSSLKAVSTHKKITLYVSPKEKSVVDANRNKLKSYFEQLEVFQIRERADIEPGGVVIETEGGIINAKLENQWAVLEKAFENLFKGNKST
jgi:type III secretion protein L